MQSPYSLHAVYLNNVGCALLKRCAFEDAARTFSDALFLANQSRVCSTAYPSGKAFASHPEGACHLQEKLQKANQCIASPNICSCKSCSISSAKSLPIPDTKTKAPPSSTILKLEDYYQIDVDEILLQPSVMSPMVCPVHIEEQELAICSQDLSSGIMMLNLGLSYTCLSKCNIHGPEIMQQFRAGATRMLQLADSLLHGMLVDVVEIENYEQWEQLKLCTCVDMAVLHSILQLVADNNHEQEVNSTIYAQPQIGEARGQLYFRMFSLRAFVDELEYEFFGGSAPCSKSGEVAAAA